MFILVLDIYISPPVFVFRVGYFAMFRGSALEIMVFKCYCCVFAHNDA